MPNKFESLTAEEKELLYDAIPLITVLVAGADGSIDTEETNWGHKITEIRTYKSDEELKPYYQKVLADFDEKVEKYAKELPKNTDERQQLLADKLAGLNDIFPKLDSYFANILYKSLRSYAKHVAEASGGIFGVFSIGPKEDKVINLPMIEPIQEVS